MIPATLVRDTRSVEGTFGVLTIAGKTYQTGELPWYDNTPNISCIPPGVYTLRPYTSETHGLCLMLYDVPGRTDCEMHAGNWCGDKAKGYRSDVLGCIIVGLDRGRPLSQAGVTYSRDALKEILDIVGDQTVQLTITEAL